MIQGEYVLNTLFGLERVWNRYGTDTQFNITFHVLHSMVWNGGVWNGIRGVWIRMCARLCSGPFISSGSHMSVKLNSESLESWSWDRRRSMEESLSPTCCTAAGAT